MSRLFLRQLVSVVSPQYKCSFLLFGCKGNKFCRAKLNYCADIRNFSKAVAPQQPVDLLMQNIRSASDTSDVLYSVQQHHAIMNDMHVIQALQSIFVLQKSQSSSMTNGELIKHDSFQLLCKILQQKIRFLNLNEHVNALKVLSFVGVPSTSKIMQILLQLVSKRVNELTLQQIVFLDFVLKDFNLSPLVEALKIALPIVFEAQFKIQSDVNDMKQLTDFFVFAVKKRLSDNCISLFVNKINENRDNIDVDCSKVIVRTLCEAKRVETPFRNLLHQSLDNIVDNVNKFTFLDLSYILSRLSSNFGKKNSNHFYHEEFVDCVANYVIDKECDAEQVTWILKSINKFKHMHKGVIDYICEVIAENPSLLENWSVGMLASLVNSMSISDYRPDSFILFQENLVNNLLKFTKKMELPWLRITLDLCSLDCWSYDLFNSIFQEEFLNNFLMRGNIEDLFELLQLYQAIQTMCPTYNGNLPSQTVINDTIMKIRKFKDTAISPLLPALVHGLGGPNYVFSPAYTKLGHFIDHVLVMRKGGYSVSINNSPGEKTVRPINVEDLHLPEDSQILLVLFLLPKCYTLNTERITGHARLNINTLEKMGYSVVSVTQSTWENLLDGERIPFIMQSLQNKCQDLEHIAASRT